MEFQTTPPTAEQVAEHVRKHPAYGFRKKKRGKETLDRTLANGCAHWPTVEVYDIYAVALWLVKLPHSGVDMVTMRVIKGVVYQRGSHFAMWHAVTGDWLGAKYMPLTSEGLPVDYETKETK